MHATNRSPPTDKGNINLYLTSFTNPVSGLSEEERLKLFSDVAKHHEEDYLARLRRIEELIRSANPLNVLAHYAYYDLLLLDQIEGRKEIADKRLQQHNVELLQALYLTLPASEISRNPIGPSSLAELSDCLSALAPAFSLKRLADKPSDVSVLPVELIRMHTQAIRNLGYPEQIFTFLTEVFAPLDSDMAKLSGIKPSLLVAMMSKLMRRVEDSVNDRRAKLRLFATAKTIEQAVGAYYKLISTDENMQKMLDLSASRKWTLLETKTVLLLHFDLDLWTLYQFSPEDFVTAYPESISEDAIRTLLALWSFKPGDLHSHNKEHFFLSNPIWKRPIIQLSEDAYFWPMLQMFMSFGLEMLEALIERHPEVKRQYEDKTRPKYLEDRAARVFRDAFPRSTVLQGSRWYDSATKQIFENDLLILMDSFLLVVECKSGSIPPSARRGGERLEVAVRKLVKEPAEQSARFVDFLLKNRGAHAFETKRGTTNNCDTSKVRHVIRLSLTLDFFGPLTCMSRLLEKGGILQTDIPPAVTMPLVALETSFELLDGAHQKLHYLSRRSEWESHVDYMADEYDLLAFYIATGFNVGAVEFDNEKHLMLYGLSEKLDEYFRAKVVGKRVSKPSLKLTRWWRDILGQSEERAFEGWTDVGMSLLSASRSDQWKFEKAANKLKKNVRANWQMKGHENFLVGTTGPAQRQTAISAYAFKDHITREKRDANLHHIFKRVSSETGCKDVLVIGVDADDGVYPYQFIAFAFDIEVEEGEATLGGQ
jgi:hypothetical protein